ncbi:DedA family protein [Microbacterium proteolyticum]|uniref:DedA family protein n=1 Tax=Microbacterium TaxID=33882 RepID=UPI00097BB309|nr:MULTISPECIES: DedA family protein [Microbacterium]MDI9890317.1 DedA family protein [Microbacterium sp. IEGM 1404]MXS73483.1 DedA family protein [Microbacterium sp. TL13]ONI62137.1 DedA family protein [Microbacterium sp. CSI-V]
MNEILTWLLDVVQNVDPVVRTLVAGVAMMLETSVLVGLVVPGDTVVIVAGTAIASPLEGILLGVAVVIGSLAGESLGFWLGRYFGPRIRASRLGQKLGDRNWERADRYLRRRGGPAIFLSRFLPVLHSLVPLTVGMSGYRYRRFLAWTAPACIVWAGLYITVAATAAGTYRELADRIHYAGYVFVGIIVVFLLLVYIGKKVLERIERRHLAEEHDSLEPAGDDVKD